MCIADVSNSHSLLGIKFCIKGLSACSWPEPLLGVKTRTTCSWNASINNHTSRRNFLTTSCITNWSTDITIKVVIIWYKNKLLSKFWTYSIVILTTRGTCSRDDNSSWSWVEVCGWTKPPWLDNAQYEPTNTLLATVCRNTSTFSTSDRISSVSWVYTKQLIYIHISVTSFFLVYSFSRV